MTTSFDPDAYVYGGGGCVDVEVRCTVRDLLRLTNGDGHGRQEGRRRVMNERAAAGQADVKPRAHS